MKYKVTTIDEIENIVSDITKLNFYPTKNCKGSRVIVNATADVLKKSLDNGQYPALEVKVLRDKKIIKKIRKILKNSVYQPNTGVIEHTSWEEPVKLIELLRSIGAIVRSQKVRLWHLEIRYPFPHLLIESIISKTTWSYHKYCISVEEIGDEIW